MAVSPSEPLFYPEQDTSRGAGQEKISVWPGAVGCPDWPPIFAGRERERERFALQDQGVLLHRCPRTYG